jgi:predicted ester cyclase
VGMKGFDPRFEDLPAFILGITHEIWEERQIETLYHYYADDIPIRTPDGLQHGNQEVIDATRATLEEFPDRQLFGEDVIWSGDEDTGFLSSHRILSTATHTGAGSYGPPSGTKLTYRAIADCAAINNQIYDEWLIRDRGAIVRQLGMDPKRFAADLIAAEGGPEQATQPLTPETDAPLKYAGRGNTNDPGGTYADLLSGIMQGDEGVIEGTYDRAVQLDLPGGYSSHSWSGATEFWNGLCDSFPGARFEIHHQIGRTDPGMAPRAALRWSLTGTHDGSSNRFGPRSGANVHVMGLSHAEFGPNGLRREWVLFDETVIWKQILLHTG